MKPEPTVFVVDDDVTVRDGLRCLLESVELPVETFASGQEFLNAYRPPRGGCLVLDLRMPGMSGLELQEQLLARRISLPVIIVTGHGEVATAVKAMRNGALDFFQKPYSQQELLDRIQQALARDAKLRAEQNQFAEFANRLARLTTREQEVLYRIVEGKANKVVAGELGISVKTVEAFRAKIMEKTQAQSLADLVRVVYIAHGCAPPVIPPLAPPTAPS